MYAIASKAIPCVPYLLLLLLLLLLILLLLLLLRLLRLLLLLLLLQLLLLLLLLLQALLRLRQALHGRGEFACRGRGRPRRRQWLVVHRGLTHGPCGPARPASREGPSLRWLCRPALAAAAAEAWETRSSPRAASASA